MCKGKNSGRDERETQSPALGGGKGLGKGLVIPSGYEEPVGILSRIVQKESSVLKGAL